MWLPLTDKEQDKTEEITKLMGLKYTCSYYDSADNNWLIEIDVAGFSGTPVEVRGAGDICVLNYTGDKDNWFEDPIVSLNARITLYNQNGEIDIEELQLSSDKDVVITVYRESSIKFKGYMIPDGIERRFAAYPYTIELNATDGLKLLETLPYTHNNLPAPTGGAIRIPLNYFRQILFSNLNLGLPLPIRWALSELECLLYPDSDVFAGLVQWSTTGEGFANYEERSENKLGTYKSCLYILKGLLVAFGARMYQQNVIT